MLLVDPKMKRRTPLVVCDCFPPDVGGGASTATRVSRYLGDGLVSAPVVVIKSEKASVHYNGEIFCHNTLDIIGSFTRKAKLTAQWSQLIPQDIEPFSIVSLYMGRPSYIGHLIACALDLPHYIVCLGSDININFERFAKKWRYPKLIRFARGIGVVSPEMIEKLSVFPLSLDKVSLVAPGFDCELYRPLQGEKKIDFLFVGRAKLAKGLDRFISALAEVKNSCHVCLIIPYSKADELFYENCYTKAKRVASHHAIVWLRSQTSEQMCSHYNSSRFVVVPSRSEGAPHVVLEAMACNVPVIASDVGRIAYFLGDTGLLFRTDIELNWLLNKAVNGELKGAPGMRSRAIQVASSQNERESFRRFVELEA